MALTIKVMNAIKLDGVHEILDELFIIYMFTVMVVQTTFYSV